MLKSATTWNYPKVNIKSIGAGLLLAIFFLTALVYLRYASSRAGKRSWINASIAVDGEQTSRMTLTFNILMYCMISSMLLVINKVTVGFIPLPGLVLVAQLSATVLYVKVMEASRGVEVDTIQRSKVISFLPVICGFVGMLFSNIKALQYVPVDTFICARASTPIVIALAETLFLGRELPSMRSWAALLGLLIGVYFYVNFDFHFSAAGYMWIGIWYSIAVAEMIVVKRLVTNVNMTTWGRTYYMNALSVAPLTVIGLVNGELLRFSEVEWSASAIAVLILSCLGGVGMSYYSFAVRAMISATSFSLIGNVCKVITILVNILIWDQHSGASGTIAILLCLGASAFYKQAPMRGGQGASPFGESALVLPSSRKNIEKT
uniref:Sugar phosphate transporter domain-containing protein n=1 Tax=Tetraselmis chuii TaxID=63592 RepID=A0A7S1ST82_9CHLO